MGYVTDEVRGYIGLQSEKRTCAEPIGTDTLRRFNQATMEPDPVHWDPDAAAAERFGGVVAPLLFPVHAFRRPSGSPDPLDRAADNPDWDGSTASENRGLPELPLPLTRHLNAGSEVEFFEFAKAGDTVSLVCQYVDIQDKVGRSGPLVLEQQAEIYSNQHGSVLLKLTRTRVHR
jgi:hypothetical protein